MSPLIDFYRDNPEGCRAHPSGYSHFDITNNWTDSQWEGAHDFIQWLFPLKEPSMFNPDAPLLTDEDIEIFRNDVDLKQSLFFSYLRFMKFLGFRCRWLPDPSEDTTSPGWRVSAPVTESGFTMPFKWLPMPSVEKLSVGKWVVEPIPSGEHGIGDEFFTKAEITKKQEIWEHPNHNWLRITRCLLSLRLLGLESASVFFFDALCKLYDENRGITPDTFQYWQEAAQGGLWK